MKYYTTIVIWILLVIAISNSDKFIQLGCQIIMELPCVQAKIENHQQTPLLLKVQEIASTSVQEELDVKAVEQIIKEWSPIYEALDTENSRQLIALN